jgi:hypothetical protein
MSEENKIKARRVYEEAWDQGKLDVLDELLAPDFVRLLIPWSAQAMLAP